MTINYLVSVHRVAGTAFLRTSPFLQVGLHIFTGHYIFRLPTILLKTILMIPLPCAYSALAFDAYPLSVALSRGILLYEAIN
jgi:hypothetical protein